MSSENVHTDVPLCTEDISLIIYYIIKNICFGVYTEIHKMSNQRRALINLIRINFEWLREQLDFISAFRG